MVDLNRTPSWRGCSFKEIVFVPPPFGQKISTSFMLTYWLIFKWLQKHPLVAIVFFSGSLICAEIFMIPPWCHDPLGIPLLWFGSLWWSSTGQFKHVPFTEDLLVPSLKRTRHLKIEWVEKMNFRCDYFGKPVQKRRCREWTFGISMTWPVIYGCFQK